MTQLLKVRITDAAAAVELEPTVADPTGHRLTRTLRDVDPESWGGVAVTAGPAR